MKHRNNFETMQIDDFQHNLTTGSLIDNCTKSVVTLRNEIAREINQISEVRETKVAAPGEDALILKTHIISSTTKDEGKQNEVRNSKQRPMAAERKNTASTVQQRNTSLMPNRNHQRRVKKSISPKVDVDPSKDLSRAKRPLRKKLKVPGDSKSQTKLKQFTSKTSAAYFDKSSYLSEISKDTNPKKATLGKYKEHKIFSKDDAMPKSKEVDTRPYESKSAEESWNVTIDEALLDSLEALDRSSEKSSTAELHESLSKPDHLCKRNCSSGGKIRRKPSVKNHKICASCNSERKSVYTPAKSYNRPVKTNSFHSKRKNLQLRRPQKQTNRTQTRIPKLDATQPTAPIQKRLVEKRMVKSVSKPLHPLAVCTTFSEDEDLQQLLHSLPHNFRSRVQSVVLQQPQPNDPILQDSVKTCSKQDIPDRNVGNVFAVSRKRTPKKLEIYHPNAVTKHVERYRSARRQPEAKKSVSTAAWTASPTIPQPFNLSTGTSTRSQEISHEDCEWRYLTDEEDNDTIEAEDMDLVNLLSGLGELSHEERHVLESIPKEEKELGMNKHVAAMAWKDEILTEIANLKGSITALSSEWKNKQQKLPFKRTRYKKVFLSDDEKIEFLSHDVKEEEPELFTALEEVEAYLRKSS